MHPGMWLQLTQEAEPRKDPSSGPPCSLQVRLMQESVRRIIEAEESRMGEKAWPFRAGWARGAQRSTALLQPSLRRVPS